MLSLLTVLSHACCSVTITYLLAGSYSFSPAVNISVTIVDLPCVLSSMARSVPSLLVMLIRALIAAHYLFRTCRHLECGNLAFGEGTSKAVFSPVPNYRMSYILFSLRYPSHVTQAVVLARARISRQYQLHSGLQTRTYRSHSGVRVCVPSFPASPLSPR